MTNEEVNKELIEQVISRLRSDNAAFQEVSVAILSGDRARISEVFHRVVGVDLTDAQLQTLLSDYSSEERIAALT